MKQPIEIDRDESAELAAAILGIDPPGDDCDVETIDSQFYVKTGFNLDDLAEITALLLPLCAATKGSLTGDTLKGFARDGVFIVKIAERTL